MISMLARMEGRNEWAKQNAEGQDFTLTPPTPAELRLQAELKRRAEEEEKRARLAGDVREFILMGSKRAADMPGQCSLFD